MIDQNNLAKPKDVVEHFVQKNNHQNKVKEKANHETKKQHQNNKKMILV